MTLQMTMVATMSDCKTAFTLTQSNALLFPWEKKKEVALPDKAPAATRTALISCNTSLDFLLL